MWTGAHLLVRALKSLGTEQIFGLCGDHINAIFDACLEEGVRVIDVRQESAAVHMADAWARVTGRPGVSVVTGGPGHTNSITGIATAWMAGSPVISISGMHRWDLRDRGALQEIHQVELVRPFTKWAQVVTEPVRLGQYAAIAYREAVSGRPGPVHLTIPSDILEAAVDPVVVEVPGPWTYELPSAPPAAVERALGLLACAERPVVVAGSGVWWAQAWDALRRFVETTATPCFTIGMARGTLSDDHPLCFGYADPNVNPVAGQIPEADVVLLLGKRVDYRLAYGALFGPTASIIQVDLHPAELGRNRPNALRIQCGAGAFLAAMAAGAKAAGPWREKPWVEELRSGRRSAAEARRSEEFCEDVPIHPLRVMRELREALPDDVVWAIDGGDFIQWARVALPARRPGHWLRLGPLGTLGAAIPFGIAAKLARRSSPVIILIGDGGMGFHSWELHTAQRHGLPVVVVVGNDGGWGMERELQLAFYGRTVGVDLGRVRYDRVVEAMGGHGELVAHPSEFRPALERALRSGRVGCVNVMTCGVGSPLTRRNIAHGKAASGTSCLTAGRRQPA